MNNKLLLAIAGFNFGIIGTMMIAWMMEVQSLFLSYGLAAIIGIALAGLGYVVGGMMA